MLMENDKLQLGLATENAIIIELFKLVGWIIDNEIISEVGQNYIDQSFKNIKNLQDVLNNKIT